MGASTIDEQISHDLGCEREKMGAIGEVDVRRSNETNVRLVYQLSGVQRVFGVRIAQTPVGQCAEPVIHERNEPIARAFVACAP
jgi:hypothetical protein